LIHFRATRLLNFREHGIRCVKCGVQGCYFLKEVNGTEPPHLNLYAINLNGRPILMTQDHIKPKSKGGSSYLFNLQPMCVACNCSKSDDWGFGNRMKYFFRLMKHKILETINKIFKVKK
jgi:5-methylcytosine-specific restriction endonuclease McrA